MACYRQNKLSDAEKLRREELAGWKMMHGNISNEICNTLHWLARALLDQDRYDEAEELWREDLKGRTYLLGEKNSARLNAMGGSVLSSRAIYLSYVPQDGSHLPASRTRNMLNLRF